ncbi:MAG: hypothetical protein IJU41_02635, partial [Clostridia bacterium]|nr:hypothetical protein [Clostridia bacterium]
RGEGLKEVRVLHQQKATELQRYVATLDTSSGFCLAKPTFPSRGRLESDVCVAAQRKLDRVAPATLLPREKLFSFPFEKNSKKETHPAVRFFLHINNINM